MGDRGPYKSLVEGRGAALSLQVALPTRAPCCCRCADFVVLNKTDMLSGDAQLEELSAIVASLNPLATVIPCTQGKVGWRAGVY